MSVNGRAKQIIAYFFLSVAVISLYSISVFSQSVTPEGPDSINVTNSSRGSEGVGPVTIQAEAGNVTGLKIYDQRLTEAWQGYYGNITGAITLQDGSSNIFYDWQIANPRGEIYASNSSTTVRWTSIYCLNVSQNEGASFNVTIPFVRPGGAVSDVNSSRIELSYGINATDLDGLNETFFSEPYTGSFSVAGTTIDSTDGCSFASPYVSNLPSVGTWNELILSDNQSIIFTAVIRENAADFRGQTSDFQMLVLENGHTGLDTSTTPYYFYVELS